MTTTETLQPAASSATTSAPPSPAVAAADAVAAALVQRRRWRIIEVVFWLVAFASYFVLPDKHLILNEVAIMALFAISLDLILGYCGIVSLGHAAFLGMGAYSAALFAKHFNADPLIGLVVAALASTALGFVTSFLVLRGSDLSRLMITIGVALILSEFGNQLGWLTGGADGLQGVVMDPLFGQFRFDMFGRTAHAYSLVTLFILFVIARRITNSPFGVSLCAIRDNKLRASAIGIPVNARLISVYTLSACYAGIAGGLLAQTSQYASLDVLSFERSADVMLVLVIGGAGYLYGGVIGAIGFKLLQDWLSAITPQYWHFWVGLILVILVLIGRQRLQDIITAPFARLFAKAKSPAATTGDVT
jgi:branched-chain amino acid transport system permease protein